MKKPVVSVIGAGSYGTAIAVALSKNGNTVILWGHNSNHIQNLNINRSNQLNLPDIFFPPSLYLEESLSVALGACSDILMAVPSHVFSLVLKKIIKLNLTKIIRVIVGSKGLEPKTGQLFKDVVYDILGHNVPVAVISGPTFARELAMGLPTAVTLAFTDIKFGNDVQRLLHSIKNFRTYIHTDIIGVQVAGAVKNVIAIGSGISDGMGFGSNARIALITRGLAEMTRLGVAMGAKSDVFMCLSGVGDLVLTCTDDQSRNRRFGIFLGKGIHINQAQKNIGQVIEGIRNTKEVYELSLKYRVIMPITKQIYQIVYENKDIQEAAHSLLTRSYTD